MNLNGHLSDALRQSVENVVVLDHVDSTHSMAQRLIEQMDDEGLELQPTVLIASSQSAGIGRGDRNWQNADQGLYLNWVRSGLSKETVARLPMLAVAALHSTLTDLGISNAVIKWPNDLLIDSRKIAGILVHARHSDEAWATVGVGINLRAAPILDDGSAATAVADHLDVANCPDLGVKIAVSFVGQLNLNFTNQHAALERWRHNLIHENGDLMQVRLASGRVEEGALTEITDEGFLKLATTSGERIITGGDIIE